ncbi:MAG: hypothetical protein H6699_05915 [Myxococcales bacterium]|nr:hypothetical protein [Myxococcales bacterium]
MRSPTLWSTGFATTMVGGTALFAFGIGAVIHARTPTSSCDSFLGCYGANSRTHAWLPLAFGGGALIAAGIPMWIVGGSDPRLEPAIAPTPVTGRGRGAHGSLRFEF